MTKRTIGIIRKRSAAKVIALLTVLALFFSIPAAGLAADVFLPSFGEGKVKVRLYADYFCPPCRDMAPDLEPVIKELVRDKIIELSFNDTPFYRLSSLYVRHFLYAINEKKDLGHALMVRRLLMDAAKQRLDSAEKLEALLKEKNIALKPFDPKPTFEIMSRCLKEDKIEATPTCVIESDGKKNRYVGAGDIIDALNQLKKKRN